MFSNLKSQVSIMTTVMASAILLLQGLHKKLEQELENTRRTGDLAGVSDVVMALKDQTSQLASAVAANTIADPNAGSIGLMPSPGASLENGGVDNTVTGEGEASEHALVGENEAAGEQAEAIADGETDKSVEGTDAADNADGSGAEVGTDTATEVAVEASLTSS